MKTNKYILTLALTVCCALGNLYAINSSYYSSIDGKKDSGLRDALYTITSAGPQNMSYDKLWTAYKTTDVYPSDSVGKAGKIWDMYSNVLFTAGTNQCGSYSNVGDCYNREHSLPKSWFNEATPAYYDLGHIVPTDGYVNNQRSNYAFGECASGTRLTNGTKKGLGKLGTSTFSGYTNMGKVFEPDDIYKGDFARMYMYMVVRYKKGNSNNVNLAADSDGQKMFNSTDANYGLTDYSIALLMKWHRQDPVSQKEIDRNNGMQTVQNNRNPFIDYPCLAEYLWGNKAGETVTLSSLVGTFTGSWTTGDGCPCGTDPAITLPTGDIFVGSTEANSPVSKNVMVQGVNLTAGLTFTISGTNAGLFSLSQNSMTQSVATTGANLAITYTPTAAGEHTATLTISGGGLASSQTFALSGTCCNPYTVTYSRNGITEQVGACGTFTLPTAEDEEDACDGWEFQGWLASTTSFTEGTTTAPTAWVTSVTSSKTLHAVYGKTTTTGGGSPSTATYTFKSKSWTATEGNWTSGKDGNGYNNSGVQVTTGTNQANATCPSSYSNITSIVVSYCTNGSSGAGSITMGVGSTELTQTVTKTGGTTARNLEFDFSSTKPSGSPKITVNCTTNSIYVCGVTITYGGGGTTTTTYKKLPCTTYTISYVDEDGIATGGSYQASETTALAGTTISLDYDEAMGYEFTGWTVTNASTSATITVSNGQFTMPEANVTVQANFNALCSKLSTPDATAVAGDGQITLTWEDVTDAVGYTVSIGGGVGYTTECGGEASIADISHSGTTNTCVISGLTNGLAYTTYVVANGISSVCDSDEDEDTTIPSAEIPTEVTVTFNANGGEGTMSDQTIPYNTATALDANAFTRTGYTFQGWATEQSGAKEYNDGASVTLTEDITLYAVWQINSHNVTFTQPENGGTFTVNSSSISPVSNVDFGSTVTIVVTPTNSHFTVGAVTVSGASGSVAVSGEGNTRTFTMPDNDVIVSVSMNEDTKYTVNWYVSGTPYPETNYAGEALAGIANPSIDCNGKTFQGWTATEINGEQATAPTDLFTDASTKTMPSNNDVKYYAVFAEVTDASVTATFDPATASGLTESPTKTWTHDATGVKMQLVGSSSRYTNGTPNTWTMSHSSGSKTVITSPTNITQIVVRSVYQYTSSNKTYNGWINDASVGTLSPTTFTSAESDGYVTQTISNINAKSVTIQDNSSSNGNQARVIMLTVTCGSTTYANYTTSCSHESTVTITFDKNGGSGNMAAQVVNWGEVTALNANTFTAPTGHHFLGWSESSTSTTATYTDQASVTYKKDVTLYAIWEANSRQVSYEVTPAGKATVQINSSATTPQNVNYGTTVTVTVTPATHYSLTGITLSTGGSVTINDNSGTFTMPDENVTVTVTVTEDVPYTVTWDVAGSTSTETHYAGEALTGITAPTSDDCGGKAFVGWTAHAGYESETTAPDDLFTDLAGKVTPVGGTTYYAVFADEGTGSVSSVALINEEFDNTSSGDATAVITSSTFSNFSGSTDKAYKSKYGGLKLGSSSNSGYITTKSLDLSTAFTVALDVRAYGSSSSDGGDVYVQVADDDGSKQLIEDNDLSLSEFKHFELSFAAATSSSAIEIGTTSKRAYIDNVVISAGSGTTYTGYTTSCVACENTVTINKGTPSNGSFSIDKTGAQNNCSSGGLVVTVSDITPASGYEFGVITQTGINSGVTIDQSAKTVTYAQNVTGTSTINVVFVALPTYTIRFIDNGAVISTQEVAADQSAVKPSPNPTPCDEKYTFEGWANASLAEDSETKPTLISDFTASANQDYYAVYSYSEESESAPRRAKMEDEVTDVLTRETMGVTGTAYDSWSGVTCNSSAVYAGQSAGGNTSIQLRSKNSNSGIISTNSGGKLKSVTVVWNSSTADAGTLNVYGKNSAYSAPTDLYGENAGTSLGTIVKGTSTELTITGDYEYIGLRSASGALYLTSVSITWSTGSGGGGGTTTTTYYTTAPNCEPAVTPTDMMIVAEYGGARIALTHNNEYTSFGATPMMFVGGKYYYPNSESAATPVIADMTWQVAEVDGESYTIKAGEQYLAPNNGAIALNDEPYPWTIDEERTICYDAKEQTFVVGGEGSTLPKIHTVPVPKADDIQLTSLHSDRTLTPKRFGTLCLPHAVALPFAWGVRVYSVAGAKRNDNGDLTGIYLEEETKMLNAGQPYMIEPLDENEISTMQMWYAEGMDYVTEPIAANAMVGNLNEEPKQVPRDCYGLSNNQLRRVMNDTQTIGQYKAYFDLKGLKEPATMQQAYAFKVMYVEESEQVVTDVTEVPVAINWDEPVYNILGMRVDRNATGVLIQGGTKFIIRVP